MILLYLHCPFTGETRKIVTLEGFSDDELGRTLKVKTTLGPVLEDLPYLSLQGVWESKNPMKLHLKFDPTRNEPCKGCTANKLLCKALPEPKEV